MSALSETLRYVRLCLHPSRTLKDKGADSSSVEIYFSLTTTPGRIHRIRPTLRSLLDQSVKATGIILNIPEVSRKTGTPYSIPQWLQKSTAITINRCEDYGPATKTLPTLQLLAEKPGTLIIVVDDDQIYPRELVATHFKASKELPNTMIGLLGWKVSKTLLFKDKTNISSSRVRFFKKVKRIKQPVEVDVLQGSSSYLLTSQMFDTTVFDLPEAAYFADDIWIAGIAAKRGIKKVVIPAGFSFSRLHSMFMHNRDALKKNENRDNQHNEALYHLFKAHWRH